MGLFKGVLGIGVGAEGTGMGIDGLETGGDASTDAFDEDRIIGVD